MKQPNRQAGFSLVEGLVIAAVVIVIGLIGYFTVFRGKSQPKADKTSQQAQAMANEADLSAAVDDLNAVDINTESEEAALRDLVE